MVTKISDFLNTTFSTLTLNDAINNSVVYPGTIVHTTTGTPGSGIGAGLQFQVETSNNNNETGMTLETLTTDVTAGSEDFDFIVKLMQNGAAAGERLRLNSAGQLTVLAGMVATSFTPNGSTVPTNGMYLPTTNTVGFSTNAGEKVRIDSLGNVGIGTTSPDSLLSIRGGTAMTFGWNRAVSLNATYPVLVFNSNNTKYSGMGVDFSVASAGLVFWTNGSSADISGTGTVAARISHLGNIALGDNAAEPPSKLVVISSSGAAPVNTTGSGAVRLRSTATAGVGVGPSVIFEGQTNNTTANYGFAAIQGFKSSATAADYSGSLAFYTQNAGGSTAFNERMRIDGNGSVGIATTTPGSVLDVNGVSSFRSAISVAGAATVASLSSNGAISGTTGVFSTSLYSATFNTAGTATVASLVSNGAVSGTTGTFTSALYGASFNTAGTATVASLVSNGAVSGTTGAFSGALTLTSAAPQINLNNGTSNWIAWNTSGGVAPSFTTRSAGTKLVLYPEIGAAAVDYAIGIEGNAMWFSVPNNSARNFKWYGGVTQAMLLSSAGALTTTTTTTSTAFIPSGSTVPANGMYLPAANTVGFSTNSTERVRVSSTGLVGIGTISPVFQVDNFLGAVSSNTGNFGYNAAADATTNVGYVGYNLSLNNSNANATGFVRLARTASTAYLGMEIQSQSRDGIRFLTDTASPVERMRIDATGNVGIGTSTIQTGYKLQVEGDFAATSKSFVINHPTKPGMMLRYGSLESPYHGIRLTGEGEVIDGKCTIQLPEYTHALCKQEDAQVQLTNIKHGRTLWIDDIDIANNQFTVRTRGKGKYRFYWSFTAVRKDIEDMLVEFDKQ